MTGRATYDDAAQLRQLWKLVFGDSESFLDSFFENLFHPEECLVTRSEAMVTSMLFMLPAIWSAQAGDFPMRYVYACATHPAHRRQGLMGRLLEEAVRYAAENGLELALVPEDEHLAAYYRRFGFTKETCLYMRKYPPFSAAMESIVWEAVPVGENAAALLGSLRMHFWHGKNAVLWPEAHLKVTLGELFARKGEFIVMKTGAGLPEGYALAFPDGGTVKIQECASTLPQDDMITSLRRRYKNKTTLFSLARGVAGSCAQTPYGLLHTGRSGDAPYLGLALDF